jgi:hypothetical protein
MAGRSGDPDPLAIPAFAAIFGAAARVSQAPPDIRRRTRPQMARIQLLHLAHARSGDKGDTANVGVIALRPEYYPILVEQLTTERVKRHFEGLVLGDVERYELPNLEALNFLLHNALGGGGTVSLKTDAQGKVMSTAILRMEIDVPDEIAARAMAGAEAAA